MIRTLLLCCVFIIALSAKSQINSRAFAPNVDYATSGLSAWYGTIDDFNNDGKKDIAVVSSNSSQGAIDVYENKASNGLINATSFSRTTLTAAALSSAIVSGDLDGDGNIDLVTNAFTSTLNPTTFTVYQNLTSSGNVSFTKVRDYTLPSDMHLMTLCDIDGDGKKDLLGGMWVLGQMRVYRNTSTPGSISFDITPYAVSSGTNSGPVVCADFDGDGKMDAAVTSTATNTIKVFRNTSTTGVISFAPFVQLNTAAGPARLSLGDLDNDGKTDLLMSTSTAANFQVFKNTSSGIGAISFGAGVSFPVGTVSNHPLQLQCVDFDVDGKPDVVVGRNNSAMVSVYKNFAMQGVVNTLSLGNKKDFSTGSATEAFVADLDGDLMPDVVSVNRGSANISVIRNQIVPSNNLVASYDFSANTGDSSGFENHATKFTGVTYTTDRNQVPNKAAYFDGTSNAYTSTPANISFNTGVISNLAVSAWINPANGTTPTDLGTPWMLIDAANHNHSLSYSYITNKISFHNYNASSLQLHVLAESKTTLNRNQWYHVMVRIDSTNRLSYFINGVLDTSVVFTPIKPAAPVLIIGKNPAAGVTGNRAFLGGIDDVKVYSRYLGDDEIKALADDLVTTYYNKPAGNLNQLSTWGSNADGSGTSPLSFDSANVVYRVINNNAPALGGTLKIKGAGSVLVMGNGTSTFNLSVGASDTLSCDSVILNNNITVTVLGNFITTKLSALSSSTVQYLSANSQVLASGIYHNLITSNSAKQLSGNTVVRATFGMLSSVNTNNFLFTLGTDAINKGTLNRMQGTITGKFTRWFDANVNTGVSGLFPVGTASKYAPLQVEYTTAPSQGGTATAEFVPNDPGITGLPVFDISNGFIYVDKAAPDGYWKISSNIGSGTFTAKVTANNFGGINNYDEISMLKRAANGSWNIPGTSLATTGSNTSLTAGRSGLTDLEAEYGIGGDASVNPLPVKLIRFTAVKTGTGQALLHWQTASEYNAAHFVVQRSTDGKTWVNRVEVAAKGQSSEIVNYNATDRMDEQHAVYYRLVQYDRNGDRYMSKVVLLHQDDNKACAERLTVYPNPAAQYLIVDGLLSEGKLYNKLGKELGKVTNGVLNLEAFPAGLYFISTGQQTIRFLKN